MRLRNGSSFSGAGTSELQRDEGGEDPSRVDEEEEEEEVEEGTGGLTGGFTDGYTGGYTGGAVAAIFSTEAAVSVSVAGGMHVTDEGPEEEADVDEHHFTGATRMAPRREIM